MINLLPIQKKEELDSIKKIKILSILGFLLLISMVFLVVLFFSIEIYLTSENQNQKFLVDNAISLSSDPKHKELENKITESNDIIKKLDDFYKKQIEVSDAIEKITNIMPDNVSLVSISYNEKNFEISLHGKAKTRDDFLAFKKMLEEQPEIKNLNSPISNILKSVDVEFSLTFSLTKQ